MQVIAEVCLVVIKEDGPGIYSILLCNPEGTGWLIPYGDVMEVSNEDDLGGPDDVYAVNCLHFLHVASGLTGDDLDEDGPLKYTFNRIPGDDKTPERIVLSYWAMIEQDNEKKILKKLEKKKGNVAFFSYDKTFPELMDPMQRMIIDEVLGHFHQRVN